MTPPVHVSEDCDTQFIETRYVPLGVVCAIAPWNFPVNLAHVEGRARPWWPATPWC